MNELINWVLNAKVKDLPEGFRVSIKNYGNYHIHIEFDDGYNPEVAVSEAMGWSYIKIDNPDPEARIIDIIEDAKKLIEKYKAKTSKAKKKHSKEA
jgi:DUF971 family protein